jgi:HEAT repeat protein
MEDANRLNFVWMITYSTTLFSLVVLGLIVCLRLFRRYHAFRELAFHAQWHPVLSQSMIEIPDVYPRLARRDHSLFLQMWVSFQESFTGEAHERLNQLAKHLGMDEVALRQAGANRLKPRLMAITALGHLGSSQAWHLLHGLIGHNNPTLSLAAARALVRVDASRGLPLVIPFFGARHDWSMGKVVQVLKEAGAHLAAPMLARAALEASSQEVSRLIKLIQAIQGETALPIVREVVDAHSEDPIVVTAALDLFGQCQDPRDLPRLRRYAEHAIWQIRLHAVIALGKMGTMDDESRLIERLSDTQWWVRYRAAEGLSRLPLMTQSRLADIRTPFAGTPIAIHLDHFLHAFRLPTQNDTAPIIDPSQKGAITA